MRRSFLLAVCLAGLPNSFAAADAVDYARDVKPILKARCFACHGPLKQKSKLRLDLREDAIKDHESGATIVPGDPKSSELMTRITTKDPDEVMPPPKEAELPLSVQLVSVSRPLVGLMPPMPKC